MRFDAAAGGSGDDILPHLCDGCAWGKPWRNRRHERAGLDLSSSERAGLGDDGFLASSLIVLLNHLRDGGVDRVEVFVRHGVVQVDRRRTTHQVHRLAAGVFRLARAFGLPASPRMNAQTATTAAAPFVLAP